MAQAAVEPLASGSSVWEPEVVVREGDQPFPQETWATFARCGRRPLAGQPSTGPSYVGPPTTRSRQEVSPRSASRRRGVSQPRPLRTAAVTLTCVGDSVDTATALRQVWQKVNLTELGIEKTSIRRARTGGLVIEIPSADGYIKADALAAAMRSVLEEYGESVQVGRPVQLAELRLVRVEASVEQTEVCCCAGHWLRPDQHQGGTLSLYTRSRHGMGTVSLGCGQYTLPQGPLSPGLVFCPR